MTREEYDRLSSEEKRNILAQMPEGELAQIFGARHGVPRGASPKYVAADFNGASAPENNGVLFFASFFVPLVGIVAGAILLTKPNGQDAGIKCIILSFLGSLIAALLLVFVTFL